MDTKQHATQKKWVKEEIKEEIRKYRRQMKTVLSKKNQWDATKTSTNRVIYIDARPSLRRKISNKQPYLPTE